MTPALNGPANPQPTGVHLTHRDGRELAARRIRSAIKQIAPTLDRHVETQSARMGLARRDSGELAPRGIQPAVGVVVTNSPVGPALDRPIRSQTAAIPRSSRDCRPWVVEDSCPRISVLVDHCDADGNRSGCRSGRGFGIGDYRCWSRRRSCCRSRGRCRSRSCCWCGRQRTFRSRGGRCSRRRSCDNLGRWRRRCRQSCGGWCDRSRLTGSRWAAVLLFAATRTGSGNQSHDQNEPNPANVHLVPPFGAIDASWPHLVPCL